MAHRRTYSARHLNMGSPTFDSPLSPPLTPPLAVLNSFQHQVSLAARKPRHFWQRTTFLALFALIVVSGYILLTSPPSLAPISLNDADHALSGTANQRFNKLSQQASKLAALRHKAWASSAARPQVTLTREQELAAVSAFLASLPQNVIPSSVDPAKPIDPQLVLDFDTRSPHAVEEVDALVNETWARFPVVLYSKVRLSRSSDISSVLTDRRPRHILPSHENSSKGLKI